MTTKEKTDKFLAPCFGNRTVTLARGSGAYVWDENGKKYLDFGGGIAVLSLGHCNKKLVKALTNQAQTLGHCSNLYMNS